ncbi:DUF721 domain-containing protein (plasmid) [Streptomyces sp. NBC_00984]|uniref:DUF721 domain-containing protein n=1 Tax=Streptomyces sp. NBC_00984 TaxID=2903700 RepID=UPI002F91681E|nr:DUF721 domain-containing protein [Streptomyces sp. NBC_00984]
MTDTTSGVDLARVALRAARAAAKTQPQAKRRSGASAPPCSRGAGRDPLSFGQAISKMVAERGWGSPAAAASAASSILDQWPAIAPELVGKADAVRFDAETRTLHLRPATPAYRTQLNLHQKQITAKVNDAVGPDTVRQLEILRPSTLTTSPPHEPPFTGGSQTPAPSAAPQPAAVSKDPVRRKAPEGYCEALAAHRATWNTTQRQTSPKIQAAIDRQIRERLREPDNAFADGRQAVEEPRAKAAAQQRARSSDAARARALQRLAAERVGLPTITPVAAPERLGRTA